ncbi:MAG TPA: high-affinity branched-chain amino acid ABC transporter permease LivM [Deltaproteobacteria bacterium]|nr:high-affinity branched-chain amino acid ABC transporter permease LivM [Deltaproteobacteria bacterium]
MEWKPLIRRAGSEIFKSSVAAVWFMFLTFPLMVIKISPLDRTIEWRWMRMVYVGVGAFLLSFIWRYMLERKETGSEKGEADSWQKRAGNRIRSDRMIFVPLLAVIGIFVLVFPFLFSSYQTSIMITALMYVMLGLGLNIVVGLAGLLDLGYVAFYAVGAYFYALMNHHFGLGFWVALPLAGALAATFGVLLGFPVLRLRGDYLAIVTLGFGEIIRLILENWNEFSFGPSGIAGISRPSTFGIKLTLQEHTVYLYYIMIMLVLFTILVVGRLRNSRIGRAWIALREDEIACQAMGIDKTKTKLMAFALGATWAGFVGCILAAKTTFINPASFTFMESAIILSIVVLGGMGSIVGVIVGAFILILLPEYLRAFSEYRMLAFGASMVLIMVFRPQGIISGIRQRYEFHAKAREEART